MEALLYTLDLMVMTLLIYTIFRVNRGKRPAGDLGLFAYKKEREKAAPPKRRG